MPLTWLPWRSPGAMAAVLEKGDAVSLFDLDVSSRSGSGVQLGDAGLQQTLLAPGNGENRSSVGELQRHEGVRRRFG